MRPYYGHKNLVFLNDLLKNVVMYYINASTGTVQPSTIHACIHSSNSVNHKDESIFIQHDAIFINQKHGLKKVMDSKFAGQQADGAINVQQNILALPDMKIIISHRICDMNHVKLIY